MAEGPQIVGREPAGAAQLGGSLLPGNSHLISSGRYGSGVSLRGGSGATTNDRETKPNDRRRVQPRGVVGAGAASAGRPGQSARLPDGARGGELAVRQGQVHRRPAELP